MLRITALAGTLLLALAVAETAGAQARETERGTIAATGDITALDAAKRTITVKSTNDEGVEYMVEESATIMRGGQTIKLDDLKVGWNVTVAGNELRDEKRLTMIKVMKAPE
jgi:ABC-type Fe3+-hydroxamate transport system substrate-binding protein